MAYNMNFLHANGDCNRDASSWETAKQEEKTADLVGEAPTTSSATTKKSKKSKPLGGSRIFASAVHSLQHVTSVKHPQVSPKEAQRNATSSKDTPESDPSKCIVPKDPPPDVRPKVLPGNAPSKASPEKMPEAYPPEVTSEEMLTKRTRWKKTPPKDAASKKSPSTTNQDTNNTELNRNKPKLRPRSAEHHTSPKDTASKKSPSTANLDTNNTELNRNKPKLRPRSAEYHTSHAADTKSPKTCPRSEEYERPPGDGKAENTPEKTRNVSGGEKKKKKKKRRQRNVSGQSSDGEIKTPQKLQSRSKKKNTPPKEAPFIYQPAVIFAKMDRSSDEEPSDEELYWPKSETSILEIEPGNIPGSEQETSNDKEKKKDTRSQNNPKQDVREMSRQAMMQSCFPSSPEVGFLPRKYKMRKGSQQTGFDPNRQESDATSVSLLDKEESSMLTKQEGLGATEPVRQVNFPPAQSTWEPDNRNKVKDTCTKIDPNAFKEFIAKKRELEQQNEPTSIRPYNSDAPSNADHAFQDGRTSKCGSNFGSGPRYPRHQGKYSPREITRSFIARNSRILDERKTTEGIDVSASTWERSKLPNTNDLVNQTASSIKSVQKKEVEGNLAETSVKRANQPNAKDIWLSDGSEDLSKDRSSSRKDRRFSDEMRHTAKSDCWSTRENRLSDDRERLNVEDWSEDTDDGKSLDGIKQGDQQSRKDKRSPDNRNPTRDWPSNQEVTFLDETKGIGKSDWNKDDRSPDRTHHTRHDWPNSSYKEDKRFFRDKEDRFNKANPTAVEELQSPRTDVKRSPGPKHHVQITNISPKKSPGSKHYSAKEFSRSPKSPKISPGRPWNKYMKEVPPRFRKIIEAERGQLQDTLEQTDPDNRQQAVLNDENGIETVSNTAERTDRKENKLDMYEKDKDWPPRKNQKSFDNSSVRPDSRGFENTNRADLNQLANQQHKQRNQKRGSFPENRAHPVSGSRSDERFAETEYHRTKSHDRRTNMKSEPSKSKPDTTSGSPLNFAKIRQEQGLSTGHTPVHKESAQNLDSVPRSQSEGKLGIDVDTRPKTTENVHEDDGLLYEWSFESVCEELPFERLAPRILDTSTSSLQEHCSGANTQSTVLSTDTTPNQIGTTTQDLTPNTRKLRTTYMPPTPPFTSPQVSPVKQLTGNPDRELVTPLETGTAAPERRDKGDQDTVHECDGLSKTDYNGNVVEFQETGTSSEQVRRNLTPTWATEDDGWESAEELPVFVTTDRRPHSQSPTNRTLIWANKIHRAPDGHVPEESRNTVRGASMQAGSVKSDSKSTRSPEMFANPAGEEDTVDTDYVLPVPGSNIDSAGNGRQLNSRILEHNPNVRQPVAVKIQHPSVPSLLDLAQLHEKVTNCAQDPEMNTPKRPDHRFSTNRLRHRLNRSNSEHLPERRQHVLERGRFERSTYPQTRGSSHKRGFKRQSPPDFKNAPVVYHETQRSQRGRSHSGWFHTNQQNRRSKTPPQNKPTQQKGSSFSRTSPVDFEVQHVDGQPQQHQKHRRKWHKKPNPPQQESVSRYPGSQQQNKKPSPPQQESVPRYPGSQQQNKKPSPPQQESMPSYPGSQQQNKKPSPPQQESVPRYPGSQQQNKKPSPPQQESVPRYPGSQQQNKKPSPPQQESMPRYPGSQQQNKKPSPPQQESVPRFPGSQQRNKKPSPPQQQSMPRYLGSQQRNKKPSPPQAESVSLYRRSQQQNAQTGAFCSPNLQKMHYGQPPSQQLSAFPESHHNVEVFSGPYPQQQEHNEQQVSPTVHGPYPLQQQERQTPQQVSPTFPSPQQPPPQQRRFLLPSPPPLQQHMIVQQWSPHQLGPPPGQWAAQFWSQLSGTAWSDGSQQWQCEQRQQATSPTPSEENAARKFDQLDPCLKAYIVDMLQKGAIPPPPHHPCMGPLASLPYCAGCVSDRCMKRQHDELTNELQRFYDKLRKPVQVDYGPRDIQQSQQTNDDTVSPSEQKKNDNMALFNDALAKKSAGKKERTPKKEFRRRNANVDTSQPEQEGSQGVRIRHRSESLDAVCSYGRDEEGAGNTSLNEAFLTQSSSLSIGTPTGKVFRRSNSFAVPPSKKKITFSLLQKSLKGSEPLKPSAAQNQDLSSRGSSPERQKTWQVCGGYSGESSSVESSPYNGAVAGKLTARDHVYSRFVPFGSKPDSESSTSEVVSPRENKLTARDLVYGNFQPVKSKPVDSESSSSELFSSPMEDTSEMDWFEQPDRAEKKNRKMKKKVQLQSTQNRPKVKRPSGQFSPWTPSDHEDSPNTSYSWNMMPPTPTNYATRPSISPLLPPQLQRLCAKSPEDKLAEVTWQNSKQRFAKRYTTTVPYIDSHCHLDFLFDRTNFNETSLKAYVAQNPETFLPNFGGCIAVFCNPRTFTPNTGLWLNVLREDSNVWVTVGCHPKSATDFNSRAEEGMRAMIQHSRVKAVGEIGLDFSGTFFRHAEVQKIVLEKQCRIAMEAKKPIVIHSRDSEEAILETLVKILPKNYKIHRHCFTGNWTEAEVWLSMFPNSYIGLTPLITWERNPRAQAPRQVAARIPLTRLLLETDAPYFVPRCISREEMEYSHPGLSITVAETVAQLQGCSLDTVLQAALHNTCDMYDITTRELKIAMARPVGTSNDG